MKALNISNDLEWPLIQVSAPVIDTTDMDPELARYLDRNFWQRKSNDNKQTVTTSTTTTPSAPVANTEPKQAGGGIVMEVKFILLVYLLTYTPSPFVKLV